MRPSRSIGRNVTGVRGDAANLDDLDRLFDTVKREKGKIDILFASAGKGEPLPLGQITEEHFDAAFDLNVRGTLFTVQKALPLFNDGASIIMTGSNASAKGFPGFGVYAASKLALRSFARTWVNELKDRKIRVNLLVPGLLPHRCRKKFSPRKRGNFSNPSSRAARWANLTKSRRSQCFLPPTTPATSMAWSCSWMVA